MKIRFRQPTVRSVLALLFTLSMLLPCVMAAAAPVGAVSTTTTVLGSESTALTTSSAPCSDCSPLVDAQQVSSLPTTFPSTGAGAPVPAPPASPYTNNTTSSSTISTTTLPTVTSSPSLAAETTVVASSSTTTTTVVASSTTTTTISVATIITTSLVTTTTSPSVAPIAISSTSTTAISSAATTAISSAATSSLSSVAPVSSIQAPASVQLSSSLIVVVGTSTAVLPPIVPISTPSTNSSAGPSSGSSSGSSSASSSPPPVVPVFAIGTQTITAGGSAITVSGVSVSLATSAFATSAPSNVAPVLTVGTTTVTANAASVFVVGTQTIVPGATAVTIQGTPVSLAPSGFTVIIAGSTQALVPTPILTIAGSTITANSAGQYIVDSVSLIPGAAPITVSGTPISLAPAANAVVVGTNTEVLVQPVAASEPTKTVVLPILTVVGSIVTPNAMSNYIIAGQTLSAGAPAITVSGTPISLAPAASNIVIGTSTELVTVTTLPNPTNRIPEVAGTNKGSTSRPFPVLQLWLGLVGIILLCAAF